MNPRQAIIAKMTGTGGISALLNTYAGAPAIFSPVIPDDYSHAEMPAAIIRRPTDFDDVSAFGNGEPGSIMLVTVAFYGQLPENSTDDEKVADAALAAWRLFRHATFVGEDGIRYQATASGPVAAPTSTPRLIGELIQLRLHCGG